MKVLSCTIRSSRLAFKQMVGEDNTNGLAMNNDALTAFLLNRANIAKISFFSCYTGSGRFK